MSYTRECAPTGQIVILRAIFTDPCGDPIDIDAGTGTIYIYDDGTYDFVDIIKNADFSASQETITSITKISTGYYEVEYTVPVTDEARWTDLWVAEIGGVQVYSTFTFNIKKTGEVSLQVIGKNTLIVILLDSDVADVNGNTLGEETQLTFSTKYDPYYASPDLLRLEAGQWLDPIPSDTLSLFIHWASIEADAITTTTVKNNNIFKVARTKFVIYDVLLRVLLLPVSLGGKQKRLGDLMVQSSSSFKEVIPEIKREREEWFRVVNSGGRIVPGQGFSPASAVKGKFDPDRRRVGRLWHSTSDFPYKQPGANSKIRELTQNKFRKGFVDFITSGYGEID